MSATHTCVCQNKEKACIPLLSITLEFCEIHETIAFVPFDVAISIPPIQK